MVRTASKPKIKTALAQTRAKNKTIRELIQTSQGMIEQRQGEIRTMQGQIRSKQTEINVFLKSIQGLE